MNSHMDNRAMNALVVLRILIGWHFLYEGVTKLYNPSWTAKGYLLSSEGFLKPFFVWLSSDSMIGFIDYANMLGLTFIGIALILGFWDRLFAVFGIILLLFYYFSHPAFPGLDQIGTEGNYWIVNKNLIEAAALWVLALIPTGQYFGIRRLFGVKNAQEKPSYSA